MIEGLPPAIAIGSTGAQAIFTRVGNGDMRSSICGEPGPVHDGFGDIRWLRQVHGGRIAIIGGSGDPTSRPHNGDPGDGLVSTDPSSRLAVFTADCAPIALAGSNGIFAAVHCGWRGLVEGVVTNAVEVMRKLGAADIEAVVGPCIGPECYEFGENEMARVASVVGPVAVAETASGGLSLALAESVVAELEKLEVSVCSVDRECTKCSQKYFSARSGDSARQACIVSAPPAT